jgi:hypothetical protein
MLNYDVQYEEVEIGWYWKLYYKRERVNGGLQPTYEAARQEVRRCLANHDTQLWIAANRDKFFL